MSDRKRYGVEFKRGVIEMVLDGDCISAEMIQEYSIASGRQLRDGQIPQIVDQLRFGGTG